MALTSIKLGLHANGLGEVVVGGIDLSGMVGGVALESRPGGPPRLVLELIGEVDLDGLGEVTIVPPQSALAGFFSNIDADELEKEALNRLGGFDDSSATQAVLDVLREWVMKP